ncbi:MAG: NAD-dependent epimerase/dehydratase family protein [Ilumatobacteraceae bacterium]
MNIVVTGATGFIGSHLCAAFSDTQHVVTMVSRSAQTEADQHSRIHVQVDLQQHVDYDTLLKDCEVVIHLAGRAHILHDPDRDPDSAFTSANTTATLNLARAAAARGVKRFIFLSSIKVNGESTTLDTPFTPESTPHPTDGYGQSKLDAELGLFHIAKSSALEVIVIRPPLVYGPGVRANFLGLMKLVHKQIPLPLGSVKNKRSLVGIDNLVSLIVTCLDHPAAPNHVFFVSDNADVSTPDLIRLIAFAQGRQPRLFPFPQALLHLGARLLHREHLYLRLCGSLQVDISTTMDLLGWKPVATPESMLAETVEYAGLNSRG